MAVTVTGTSTGTKYVVGQTYQNANGSTSTLQADGSFKNNSTGNVSVGSSQSSSVTWGTTSLGSVGSGAAGHAAAVVLDNRGAGSGVGSVKPANGNGGSVGTGSASTGSGSAGSGPGVGAAVVKPSGAGAFLGGGFLTATGAPKKITEVYIGGVKMPRDPKTSDAGDIEQTYGEGEFGSPTWVLNWGAFATNVAHGMVETISAPDAVADRNKAAIDKADAKMNPAYVPPGMDAFHQIYGATWGE